nr:methyl-CpG-binding domain-containing protein 9 [Tanacetum cinerariifolium]
MASNPENVRLTVLMKLQEALDEEAILEEQMLFLMHRFADRFMDRRLEINNLIVLHDDPLIDYAVILVLEKVRAEHPHNRSPLRRKKRKKAGVKNVVMKLCRVMLRIVANADEDRIFFNLLSRPVLKPNDPDDEGILGYPKWFLAHWTLGQLTLDWL